MHRFVDQSHFAHDGITSCNWHQWWSSNHWRTYNTYTWAICTVVRHWKGRLCLTTCSVHRQCGVCWHHTGNPTSAKICEGDCLKHKLHLQWVERKITSHQLSNCCLVILQEIQLDSLTSHAWIISEQGRSEFIQHEGRRRCATVNS